MINNPLAIWYAGWAMVSALFSCCMASMTIAQRFHLDTYNSNSNMTGKGRNGKFTACRLGLPLYHYVKRAYMYTKPNQEKELWQAARGCHEYRPTLLHA